MGRLMELKFKKLVLSSLIALGILVSIFWVNPAWSSVSGGLNPTILSSDAHIGVRITSPEKDQQVPVGTLTILGTSADNATTDCQVYVDVNDLKPYQKVEPTGPSGQSDYSNWTFTYTKNYHLISPGINELTAKITCLANPSNITKFYSVNVTGVGGGAAANQNQESPPSITNNPTGPLSLPEPSVNLKENNLVLISLSIPRPLTPKDL
jgi:hypothetical protein